MNVLAELRTGLCQALANCRRSCALRFTSGP
jgi:hypothetical protein